MEYMQRQTKVVVSTLQLLSVFGWVQFAIEPDRGWIINFRASLGFRLRLIPVPL